MAGLRDLKSIWQTCQLLSVVVGCCSSEISEEKKLTVLRLFDFWLDFTPRGLTTSCYLKWVKSLGLTCSKPRDSTWLSVTSCGVSWVNSGYLEWLFLSLSRFVFLSRRNLRKRTFWSISLTAFLTSLIFQQYSKGFSDEFKYSGVIVRKLVTTRNPLSSSKVPTIKTPPSGR